MKPDYTKDVLFQPDIMQRIWNAVTIPVLIVRLKDFVILGANPQAKKFFSRVYPDIEGIRFDSLDFWSDEKSKLFIRKLAECQKIENFELNLQLENNRSGHFLVSTDTMEAAGVIYRLVMMRDITEWKLAEQHAKESEILYESAVNHLKELIIIHDKEKIIFANEIFKKHFGIEGEGHVGQPVQLYIKLPKLIHGSGQAEISLSVEDKPKMPSEIKIKSRDGFIKYYDYNTLPFRYNDREVLMTTLFDITERKYFEQAMMGKALESAELERIQLVANLHDDLGPDLSAIRLFLSSIDQMVQNDEPFTPRLAQCITYLDDVITKLKTITADISPDVIDRFGLDTSFAAFIGKITGDRDLIINLRSNIQNLRFPSKIEINLYRIVSELIENTVEHSGADRADLRIRYGCGELIIVYKDNGKGFDVKSISLKNTGSGILNMINRINSLNGKIDFKQYEGQVITVIKVNAEPVG